MFGRVDGYGYVQYDAFGMVRSVSQAKWILVEMFVGSVAENPTAMMYDKLGSLHGC